MRSGVVVPIPPGTEEIMKPLGHDEQYLHQKEQGRTPRMQGRDSNAGNQEIEKGRCA